MGIIIFFSIFLFCSFVWLIFLFSYDVEQMVLNQMFLGELLSIFLVFILAIIIQSLFNKNFKKARIISYFYVILSGFLLSMQIISFNQISLYQKKLARTNVQKITGYIRSVDSHSFFYDDNNIGRPRTQGQLALGRNDVIFSFFSVEKSENQRIRITCSIWNTICTEKVSSAINLNLAHTNTQTRGVKAEVYFRTVDKKNILYGLNLNDGTRHIILNKHFFDTIHVELYQRYLSVFIKVLSFFLIHFLFSLFFIFKYRKV